MVYATARCTPCSAVKGGGVRNPPQDPAGGGPVRPSDTFLKIAHGGLWGVGGALQGGWCRVRAPGAIGCLLGPSGGCCGALAEGGCGEPFFAKYVECVQDGRFFVWP